MKILQLCHRVPYPLLDGGNIAMYQIGKSLVGKGHRLKILALNTSKHFVDVSSLPPYFSERFVDETQDPRLEAVFIDTTVKPILAFLNLFERRSYNVSRFYSRDFDKKLAHILLHDSFDLIQVESLFMTPYIDTIRQYSGAKLVMRAHNVEHVIWQRLAESERSSFKKHYLELLVRRLKRAESDIMDSLDAILAITPEDKAIFQAMGCQKPIEVIPVGVGFTTPAKLSPETPLCLFHLGSMDWLPNIEGINWFLNHCWPAIYRAYPQLKLYLAGRGFPDDIKNKNLPNVICEGEISDAEAYMNEKPLMVVPLLSGSGMRVKIIQGMAAGKVILSTPVGAEGIDCTDKKNILLANTPEEFLKAITYCMEHRDELLAISQSAQKLVEEKYSEKAIGAKLDAFYTGLLR